jgi:ParB/RepB/Spo0J family partition protein
MITLEDFEEPIVPLIQWPKIESQASAVAQIQAWIDAGLLVSPGNSKPSATMDLLVRAAKPAAAPPAATAPAAAPVVHSLPYNRGREARAAYAREMEGWRQGRTKHRPEKPVNQLVGPSGAKWQAGWDGVAEPVSTEIVNALSGCGSSGDLVATLGEVHQDGKDQLGIEEPSGASTESAIEPATSPEVSVGDGVKDGLFEMEDGMATATKPKGKGKAKDSTEAPAKEALPMELKIDQAIELRPWSWFKQSPYDRRSSRPGDWVKELATSLKQDGQLTPCLARPDGEHIAGWTRVLAAQLAGIAELQVRIVHCDDLTARRLVLIENAKRRQLTEREQCEAYNDLLAEYQAAGLSQKALAKELGIDHSTLSNKTRLKSLPGEVWDLYEAGTLSLVQIRDIATHAMVPGFVDAMLKTMGCFSRDAGEPVSKYQFNTMLSDGFTAAYRPMVKGSLEFKPTAAQREELKIVEVEHPRLGKIEVAANAELYDSLEKEAKEKKAAKQVKEKEAEAATPEAPAKPDKAAAKAQKEQAAARRAALIDESWVIAYAETIKARFEKPRKADAGLMTRIAILIQQIERESSRMTLDTLLSDDATFMDECRASISRFFDTVAPCGQFEANWQDFAAEELWRIVTWLEVAPLPQWRPSVQLIADLTDKELIGLRDELELEPGVLDDDRKELEKRVIEAWQPGGPGAGWCPVQFIATR